jgi:HlyD family secretion protein
MVAGARIRIEKVSTKWRNRLFILLVLVTVVIILRSTVFVPQPIEISAYRVAKGLVEETVSNSKAGTVKVRRRSNLSPEIGGRVVYLAAKEGERVKAGQVLLRLDDSEYKASLALSQRAWQAALANMKEACVSADLARREMERNRVLMKQGIISEAGLDQAINKSEAATARCEAGKAEARRAEAAVELSRASLKKTELRAPFDGVIVQLSTEVGEWVTPSPPGVPIPPVIDVLDETGIYVQAPMDETDASKLRVGLPVRINLDPYPDRILDGKLTRIASFVRDVEGQNRTVDVEAELNDHEFSKKLLPGTSADIEVILQAKPNVLRIPTYAVLEGNRVLLITQDHLVSRQIKPGLKNWEFVEVIGGLQEGDRIAVSVDKAEVKEGAFVKVTQEVKK